MVGWQKVAKKQKKGEEDPFIFSFQIVESTVVETIRMERKNGVRGLVCRVNCDRASLAVLDCRIVD